MVATWDRVRAFAFTLPQVVENFPWGESVLKIDHPSGQVGRDGLAVGPMFLWMGRPVSAVMSVKLADSYDEAVDVGAAVPTTMSGLGRWGWLTIPLRGDLELLYEWVEESYRNVAPRKFIDELDARQ